MKDPATEYVYLLHFDQLLPDESAWRLKLSELGIHHEAFAFARSPTGEALVKFWEPERIEALRILGKLDALRPSVSLWTTL